MSVHEPVLRASVRAPSGDATAAASAAVKRRTTEGLVVELRVRVAEVGQMTRIALAAGASMVRKTPSPA